MANFSMLPQIALSAHRTNLRTPSVRTSRQGTPRRVWQTTLCCPALGTVPPSHARRVSFPKRQPIRNAPQLSRRMFPNSSTESTNSTPSRSSGNTPCSKNKRHHLAHQLRLPSHREAPKRRSGSRSRARTISRRTDREAPRPRMGQPVHEDHRTRFDP